METEPEAVKVIKEMAEKYSGLEISTGALNAMLETKKFVDKMIAVLTDQVKASRTQVEAMQGLLKEQGMQDEINNFIREKLS
jgi:hypothetical protein